MTCCERRSSEGTEFGRKADGYMSAGNLVPDDVMIGVVRERLAKPDVGRSTASCSTASPAPGPRPRRSSASSARSGIDVAINLDVPLDVVTDRMKSRGRADDTDEAIARRLELYELETAPVLEWFDDKGLLVTVDGVGTEDEVFERLLTAIDKLQP